MSFTVRTAALLRHSARLVGAGLLLGGLAACGYKGPLYLPPPPDPPAALTEPPAPVAPARPSAN